jgi:pyruvate formate lyase activating enzyme
VKTPTILDIKGNSLDDGPGIRTVVFFKGCPLSCVWCHNPEGVRPGVEISFDPRECIGCGSCLRICPQDALSRADPRFVDRRKCTLCFRCAEVCPAGALTRVGREMKEEDIVSAVLKDRPFFETSGGGVTFSGGEPTMFMEFLSGILRKLKGHGVHTLLETCGFFHLASFNDLVYPFLDAIYFDLKLFAPEEHRRFCGVSNHAILENFSRLLSACRADKKEILPRVPLVPGITDTPDNLQAIDRFLQAQQAPQVELLPYNPLWPEKCNKIGMPPAMVRGGAYRPRPRIPR